jgi:hypothetical protein
LGWTEELNGELNGLIPVGLSTKDAPSRTEWGEIGVSPVYSLNKSWSIWISWSGEAENPMSERLLRWVKGLLSDCGCDASLSLSAIDAADGEGASIDLLLRWPFPFAFPLENDVCNGGNNLLFMGASDAVLDVDSLRSRDCREPAADRAPGAAGFIPFAAEFGGCFAPRTEVVLDDRGFVDGRFPLSTTPFALYVCELLLFKTFALAASAGMRLVGTGTFSSGLLNRVTKFLKLPAFGFSGFGFTVGVDTLLGCCR